MEIADRYPLNEVIAFVKKSIETQKSMAMVGDGYRNAKIKNFESTLIYLEEYKKVITWFEENKINVILPK